MGTHPIFESDFDCLTVLENMNRLCLSATRVQLSRPQVVRRRLVSSMDTGGHAHARTGYALFSSHPSWYRYLGAFLCVTAGMPLYIFYDDNMFRGRVLEQSILDALFDQENILHDLNLTVVTLGIAMVQFFVGRSLLFHNLNMWVE